MKKIKFTVNMVVKNEDLWVWYALQSVLPYADKVLIFDTGSTDKTVEIIGSINSSKITFEEKGSVDRDGLTKLRLEQIERTKTDWLLVLDGDEIWPEGELTKILEAAAVAPDNVVAIFNRTRNSIGDIYHYLPESAGKYCIGGKQGNLNIRMIRKTPDLKITGKYPLESFVNKDGPIEKQDQNLKFVDCWYLHTSFLQRSSVDASKNSGSLGKGKLWERGMEIKKEELPRVLFDNEALLTNNPLARRSVGYEIVASFTTPIMQLKRKL